jgi:hypothetical protein
VSPTSTTASAVTATFEGTVDAGGASFYSFTASQAGTVSITLASLSLPGLPAALSVPMQLGVGTPAGIGCTVDASADALPGLTPQFTTTVSSGIHCVNLADLGRLPASAHFAIRFTYP